MFKLSARSAMFVLLLGGAGACAVPVDEESGSSTSALSCNDEQLKNCQDYGGGKACTTKWCSGAATGSSPGAGDASATYSRQQVYALIKGHMRPGAEYAAADILNGGLTTQRLVDALGWIATHSPPSWEISAINSNHHADPAAHSGGYAVDLYAKNAGDDLRFVQLLNKNPHLVEIGFSGDYTRFGGEIHGKYYFTENAPTHVHAAVKQAFGTLR